MSLKTRPYQQVPNEFARSKYVSPEAKLVFIYIASFNPSYPSRESIMEACRIGKKKLKSAFDELCRLNILHIASGKQSKRTNVYHVLDWNYWDWQGIKHGSSGALGMGLADASNKNKEIRTNNKNKQILRNNTQQERSPKDELRAELQDQHKKEQETNVSKKNNQTTELLKRLDELCTDIASDEGEPRTIEQLWNTLFTSETPEGTLFVPYATYKRLKAA